MQGNASQQDQLGRRRWAQLEDVGKEACRAAQVNNIGLKGGVRRSQEKGGRGIMSKQQPRPKARRWAQPEDGSMGPCEAA